jgi:hypothetical protein
VAVAGMARRSNGAEAGADGAAADWLNSVISLGYGLARHFVYPSQA